MEKGKILVVDDDKFLRDFVAASLGKEGYEVVQAEDGEQGLEMVRLEKPDLIITDIMMPVMDGEEFCRRIKTSDELKEIFLLVLTAKSDVHDRIKVLNMGADDYITKPISREELIAKVKASMRIRSLQKQLKASNQRYQALNRDLERANQELKETQAQLLQQEKLASIGQLAAGIAHEINNPIGFINSNLGVLKEYITDVIRLLKKYDELTSLIREGNKEEVRACLEEIEMIKKEIDIDFILDDFLKLVQESREGAERVKEIVQELKDFSHVDQAEIKYADINKGLESTLNIVWNELKYKAKVIKEYGELPEIKCYPRQLNQVFMNILVNASQAIEDKGEIRIKTFHKDGYIYVQISDTGVGIPPENLSKIFDPFFTTKEVGKGTGLGLTMAYNIVKKHGGTIEVESEVGKGTTFTIKLPVNGIKEGEEP